MRHDLHRVRAAEFTTDAAFRTAQSVRSMNDMHTGCGQLRAPLVRHGVHALLRVAVRLPHHDHRHICPERFLHFDEFYKRVARA